MKIICQKSALTEAVNTALKAVPVRTTMPILECILIDASDGEISLTANDMELGIRTKVDGDVLEKGCIALEAKLFSEIVRKLPDNDVYIETDESFKALIKCEKAKFNIAAKPGEDFVSLPVVEKTNAIHISQMSLRDVIRQTIFSTSDNESNRLMAGELFDISGDQLKVVALDGQRIAIRRISLKESYDPVKMIVPGKTLSEISKILSGGIDDEVSVYYTDNHILFEFDQTVVLSRLIEGEYYQIDRMISSDYNTKFVINKHEFQNCIERASLLVRESDRKPVIISITDHSLEMKISSAIGSMDEDIDIVKEGKDMMIGFNQRFVLEALRVVEDEEITVYMVNSKSPFIIRNEDSSYIYLILPISFIA